MPRRQELTDHVQDELLTFIANVVLYNQVVAQRLGLGASDSQFLGLLRLHGPLSPRQLVDLTGLSSGTVTGVLDRLENGGFVRRERDTVDKRKVLVHPVPGGMARTAAHYAEHGKHTSAVLARRSAEELGVLASFLQDLNATPTVTPPLNARLPARGFDIGGARPDGAR